jgi:ligand-binding sensor domain-containing protein
VLFVGSALYVATDSGVCVINDPSAAVATVAATLCDSVIAVDNASSLAVSGTTLWIGSDAGLTRVTVGSSAMLTLSRDDGLPGNGVNDVTVGPDGIVWVATGNGVGRLDPATNNIVTIRPPDWSGSANVRSIAIAPDGSKWFGTAQGVVHYVGS